MPRSNSPYVVGDYWLDFRRDGKAPDIYQIARNDARSGSVVYRSTRTSSLTDAKGKILAFVETERAKERQLPQEAKVIPLLLLYWDEHGRKLVNHDQTARSLRTFIGFLKRDRAGMNAVVTDLTPALFERFREWRMGPHSFHSEWGGKPLDYASEGVSGDTVARNLNDIRAAVNHASGNMRIPLAPKVGGVDRKHLNPLRERVLTIEELGRIYWYARQHPALFRFVALQIGTGVRPDAAKAFDPVTQYDQRFGLIDLQPAAKARTKKRNAIIPAIRPLRVILKAWATNPGKSVASHKTAWRVMRKVIGLSADVYPKTIRHTIATWLYNDLNVPERQVSELLGHQGNLARTTRLYAKYDPRMLAEAVASLTTIWRRITTEARRYGSDHRLTTPRNEGGKYLARKVEKV